MWGKLRRHSNGFSAVRLYFPFVPFILVDFPFFSFWFHFCVVSGHFQSFSFHFLSCSPFPSCLASFLPFSLNFHFTFLSLLLFFHFPSFPLIFLSLPFQFPFAFELPLISCHYIPVYPHFFPLFIFPFHFPFAFLSLLLIFPSCLFHILRFSFRFPYMHYFCLHFLYFRFIILISRMFLPFPFQRFHFISPFVNDGQTQRCKSKSVAKSSEVHGGILTATSLLIHLACVMTAGFSRRFNPSS